MTDSGEQSEADQSKANQSEADQSDEPSDGSGAESGAEATVWILVDRSARHAAFETVADLLDEQGVNAQIVTITEVIGSVARDALTGGAERLLRGLRVAFQGRTAEEDLLGAVRRARPDVLAVTNPRYGKALNLLESLAGIRTLQVGILPDYNLSTDWINSSLQAFLVPTDEHRKRLVANGFLPERILVAAPAIQAGFSGEVDREATREQFGCDDAMVVLGRGEGCAPHVLEKLVFQATLVETGARFIFHHNGDSAAAAALRRAADQYGLPAAMFGKVNDLERFVAASDLVLAPTSEPYVAEFLAQGRPLLLVGAEEQGAAQAEFLGEAGAARHVVDVLRLGSEIERALDDETLPKATEAAQELGARDGSAQVARALKTAVEHSDEWLSVPAGGTTPEREPTEGPEDGKDQAPDEEPFGPFESIGTGKSAAGTAPADQAEEGAKAGRERSYSGISAAEAKEQLA
jgi:hypothetical protein